MSPKMRLKTNILLLSQNVASIFWKIVFSINFLLIFIISTAAGEYHIRGKVVDKNGRPIENAEVVTIYKDFSFERLLFPVKTDKSGKFEIKEVVEKGSSVDLYISPEPIPNTFFPLAPPYLKSLSKKYPQLVRKNIVFGNSNIINLASLQADFPFQVVKVSIVKALFPYIFEFNDDSGIYFSMHDSNGRQSTFNRLESVKRAGAIDTNSVISLVLPKGRWNIKLCRDYLCKSIIGESGYFNSEKKQESIEIKIKD